jgi:membrane-associated phospholipid phosphatase
MNDDVDDLPLLKRPSPTWVVAGFALFTVLAIVALYLWDARVVEGVHRVGLDKWAKKWNWVRKRGAIVWPGHFFCTLLCAALVARFHRTRWRGAVLLIVAGIFSGANSVIKWGVGRSRPEWKTGTPSFTPHPFKGGIKGLFSQENLAFPSGDVALAVAMAATLSYLMPRWSAAWWGMAAVVAFQRVAESSHHVSDVFAAAALGVAAFYCAWRVCRVLLHHKSVEPRGSTVVTPGENE